MNKKKSSNSDDSTSIPEYGDDELVRLSDFESTKLSFKIKNTTTQTSVKDSNEIQMVELLPKGVVLQLPMRSCSRGHNLMLELTATVPTKGSHQFLFTAKVEEVENLEEDRQDKVTLSFIQFEEAEWNALCRIFEARQNEIFNFLKAARGY